MKLVFGLQLDDNILPYAPNKEGGVSYFGPQQLINHLEEHLGLINTSKNLEYLRIEQYRQACIKHLETVEHTPFYKNAFEADAFAVAADLLSRRDELLLAGFDFEKREKTPTRISTVIEIENCCSVKKIDAGFADRFLAVENYLSTRKQPYISIHLNEPKELLPKHFVHLFEKMVGKENIHQLSETGIEGDNDLSNFKKALLFPSKEKREFQADGSLLLLRAKRANEAAVSIAKIIKENPDYRPSLIVPERNRTLDAALIKEGLPSLGIPSASLARPSLQILKLVTAFLWNPIDPYKILEFVSLAVKPLDRRLSNIIGNLMANTPGINGDEWFKQITYFFNDLEEAAKTDKSINVKEVRDWYNFWFARTRYDADATVPKGDVITIFRRLQEWAYKTFDEGNGKYNSLLVLSDQSRRIKELLEELPETALTNLELERIVRTIYEPSPIIFKDTEVEHLPYTPNASAVIGDIEDTIWWNFTQNEPVHFFSRWYLKEREYLQSLGIKLVTPKQENALLLWQRRRPVLRTTSRLLLCVPEMINGSAAHEHPLLDNMKAAFSNIEDITYDLQTEKGKDLFQTFFNVNDNIEITLRPLGRPQPFLNVPNLKRLDEIDKKRKHETYSGLNSLFYYPYQWIFRYKIKLQSSSILSVVSDKTLMGNLAHKAFEQLLKQDLTKMERQDVFSFIEKTIQRLLSKEGAVLLLYGRAPERLNFINKVKNAAWSFVLHLKENDWRVEGIEQNLSGYFSDTELRGVADLVLIRDKETAIIDLKWSGKGYRSNLVRNEEDLQLALYTHLLKRPNYHTSYFIISDAKMIARNNQAFKESDTILPDADHKEIYQRMLQKMEATYVWRKAQLENNLIEIRTEATADELEDYYQENDGSDTIFSILPMKNENAPFDDYTTLIG